MEHPMEHSYFAHPGNKDENAQEGATVFDVALVSALAAVLQGPLAVEFRNNPEGAGQFAARALFAAKATAYKG